MEHVDVLIVEDDENIRTLYKDALSGAGMRAHAVSTAREGVDAALAEHPKVILMDIMLPDMSGHDAVKEIRSDSWGADATIIFLTNRSDPEHVVAAIEQKSDDYIVKAHIEIKELINRVRLALNT